MHIFILILSMHKQEKVSICPLLWFLFVRMLIWPEWLGELNNYVYFCLNSTSSQMLKWNPTLRCFYIVVYHQSVMFSLWCTIHSRSYIVFELHAIYSACGCIAFWFIEATLCVEAGGHDQFLTFSVQNNECRNNLLTLWLWLNWHQKASDLM